MEIVCLDLEGVLVPEIWIDVARRTGIDALSATTREVADYEALMRQRLKIIEEHGLGLSDIQAVVADMGPLDGAPAFLDWLRRHFQVVILSDTFYEFAQPLMHQLAWPTLFCHRLLVEGDTIIDYRLRMRDHKRHAVLAFQDLKFKVMASGDSYNDTGMLAAADAGILFRPPDSLAREFAQFTVARDYDALKDCMLKASDALRNG